MLFAINIISTFIGAIIGAICTYWAQIKLKNKELNNKRDAILSVLLQNISDIVTKIKNDKHSNNNFDVSEWNKLKLELAKATGKREWDKFYSFYRNCKQWNDSSNAFKGYNTYDDPVVQKHFEKNMQNLIHIETYGKQLLNEYNNLLDI